MVRNKKKSPGRPKKEFVSKKPKIKIKSGPGRPRKDQKYTIDANQVPTAVVGFVAQSVNESKKKDLMILLLFFLSFLLFIVSVYFTFMRDKKSDTITQSELADITNIETGNINYTTQEGQEIALTLPIETSGTIKPIIQDISPEQQMIVDFYQAVNSVDITTLYKLTDTHLEESNVFKTYYSRRWLSNFSESILAPKVVVSNIKEEPTNSTNQNIKNFSYTLEYILANTKQKFTEERSTVVIKKGEEWRIGKLMCETKGCSMMPFFNPEKYK